MKYASVVLIVLVIFSFAFANTSPANIDNPGDLFDLESRIIKLESQQLEIEAYIAINLYTVCFNRSMISIILGMEELPIEDCLEQLETMKEDILTGATPNDSR